MLRFTPKELNNAKLVGTFESGSQEWHDARAKGIGGSEIGTIMGLNPWESAYALWAKKCKLIPEEKIDNWSMRFGRAFEEPILEMWQQEHPEWEVLTTGTYQDKSMPWRIANPDAIARHLKTGELMVIEVKTARGTWDETPAAYRAQLLWYMDVLGIHQGVIVAVAGWNWEVLTTGTYQDKSMPWRIANPDAIARHLKTGELMVIEVKTARGTWDETPAAYRAQLLWYMDVLGIHQGVIVAVAGWNWEERYIEYDKFESEVMRSVAAKFWQHVQVVERPDWDGSDQTYEVVRRQHSEIDGSTIEIGELADELKIAATEFENAKERFNKIRSKVLYGMGNAKYAVKSLGEKNSVVVASRQARANGAPWLVVK